MLSGNAGFWILDFSKLFDASPNYERTAVSNGFVILVSVPPKTGHGRLQSKTGMSARRVSIPPLPVGESKSHTPDP